MAKFVDRQAEMRELDELLKTPGSKLVAVYGRQQIGKITLVLHLTRQTNCPNIHWVARRKASSTARQGMAQTFWH
jgi:AAA+ ATPase superfamily predicted ATPase